MRHSACRTAPNFENKEEKTVVIKSIGNYEKIIAEDPDIINKPKIEAKRITADKKVRNKPYTGGIYILFKLASEKGINAKKTI